MCLFTSRYLPMAPTGSFRLANRDIWVIIGFSLSMPYFCSTDSIISAGSSLFLSLNGSIEGAIRNCLIASFCAKLGAENTTESYLSMKRLRNRQTFRSGLDASMWHRQIHLLSVFLSIRPIGWGS